MHIGTRRSKEEKAAKEERWRQEAQHNAVYGEPYNPAVRVDRTPPSDVQLTVSGQQQPLVHVTVQRSGPPHAPDQQQGQPQPGWGQSMPIPAPMQPAQGMPNMPPGFDANGFPIQPQQGFDPMQQQQQGYPQQGYPQQSQQGFQQQPEPYYPPPPMGSPTQPQGAQIRVTTTTGEVPEVNLAVVLSAHLRPQLTEPQLVAMLSQSVRPRQTVVIVTPGVPVHEQALMGYQQIRTTLQLTPWWRFQIATTFTDVTHVAVLDDDTLPGPGWIAAAMAYLADHPHDCVCAAGIVLDEKNGETRVGPANKPSQLTTVDIGEGGWLMRRDVLAEALASTVKLPGEVYGWGALISFGIQPEGRCVVLPYNGVADGLTQPPVLDQYSLRRAPKWNEEHQEVVRAFRGAGWGLVKSPVEPTPSAD